MNDHEKKYEALCKDWGIKWDKESPKIVGVNSAEELARLYKEDHNLNNVPLQRWDSLAYSMRMYSHGKPWSLCIGVCMSKHAAVEMLKRENLI